MRHHKYKIWNKAKNEWHREKPINLFGEIIVMGEILRSEKNEYVSVVDLNDLIALEFTGITDINGKEIYESDYFKNYQADLNLVEWYCGSWCYSNYHAGALDLHNNLGQAEVIGNYYSNPEWENE